MKIILRVVIMGASLALLTAGFMAQNGNDLFQQALTKERTEGKYEEAIKLYQTVVQKYGSDHKLAAKALFQMGQAYEKLSNNTEAQKVYEKLIRNYKNQAIANDAERQLTALNAARIDELRKRSSSIGTLYRGPSWISEGRPSAISKDGTYRFERGRLGNLRTNEDWKIGANDVTNWGPGDGAFSSDGTQIAYTLEYDTDAGPGPDTPVELRTTQVGQTLTAKGKLLLHNREYTGIRPFAWSPDGKEIYALLKRKDQSNLIAAISSDNGSLRAIKSLEWRWPTKLSLSPDGRYVAYDLPVARDATNRDIYVLSVDGSREFTAVEDPARDAAPVWTPDGNAVVFTSDRSGFEGLWATPIADGRPSPGAVLLQDKTGPLMPVGFSDDGSFFYQVGEDTGSDVFTAEFDLRTGTLVHPETRIEYHPGHNLHPSYSPDGKSLAYFSQRGASFMEPLFGRTSGFLTLVIRSESGPEHEIPTGFVFALSPIWANDGQTIVFAGFSDSDSYYDFSIHAIDLRTGKDRIEESVKAARNLSVTVDGKSIMYLKPFQNPDELGTIASYNIESHQESILFRGDINTCGSYQFSLSRDGLQLAFLMHGKVTILPVSGGQARELRALKGPRSCPRLLQWSEDNSSIWVQLNSGDLWSVPVDGGEPQRIGESKLPLIRSIHPNGKYIATSRQVTLSSIARTGFWINPDLLPNRQGHGVFQTSVDVETGKVHGPILPIVQSAVAITHGVTWLNDDRSIAYVRDHPKTYEGQLSDLIVRSLETGSERVFPGAGFPFSAHSVLLNKFHDGKGFLKDIGSSTNTRFFRFDIESGKSMEFAAVESVYGGRFASLSSDDRKLFVTKTDSRQILVVDRDTGKVAQRIVLPEQVDSVNSIALSPDDKTIAIVTRKGLFRIGVDGNGFKQIGTVSASPGRSPVWTPDNRSILLSLTNGNDIWRIVRIPVAENSKPADIGLEIRNLGSFDLSPDGSHIVFDGIAPQILATSSK